LVDNTQSLVDQLRTEEPVPETWRVPLSDLLLDEALVDDVARTVAGGWWSMGPRVEALEEAFAAAIGARHALAVANGTAALHLALLAAGCGPGDEVVVPSLNFVAAANSIGHVGATPVFCDIRGSHDLNADPADVEACIGPRTKAILALHYGGFPCRIEALLELAATHGLIVIEDAAHAPGARLHGRACGTFGLVGCFSFFSNKNMPIGEGGMVVTDDDDAAASMRLLRSHGMTTLTWDRHRGHASSYDVVVQGYNYRLDELRATIGLHRLAGLEAENAGRRRAAARYRSRLAGIEGLVVPFADADQDAASHHLLVVVLPERADRDAVRSALTERRIQTSVHYPPIHGFTAYATSVARPLPRTDELAPRLLTLPLFGHISDEQVDSVTDALREALER
jgi:dTDP-4-amino-4,6-dideoxygalactose transaminase